MSKVTAEEYLSLDVVNIYDKDEKVLLYDSLVESKLIEYAKKGYPYEIAGFLLGKKGNKEEVTQLYPVENVAKEQERRFEIHGLDYLKVESFALANDLDVIGIYHSHPDYPAIPSKHDLEYAQDVFAYVIISIDGSGIGLINSWKKENGKFIQQNIEVK